MPPLPDLSPTRSHLPSLEQRLAPLRQLQDGTLALIPAGAHWIQVEKQDSLILLVLLDQSSFSSQLLQSLVDLKQPDALVTPSTQALLLTLAWNPDPQHIYIAGFGGGRFPAVLHAHLPHTHITCAEIEPALVAIAQQFFGVVLDERLQVAIADGRTHLSSPPPSSPQTYDWIIIDVALGNGYTPYRMGTVEFFQLCSDRLTPEGVLAVNFLSVDPWFVPKLRTLQTVFPEVAVCRIPDGNCIAFASHHPLSREAFHRQLQQLDPRWQEVAPLLQRSQTVLFAADLISTWPDLASAPVLRDETPPADYFQQLPRLASGLTEFDPDCPCPCGSGQSYGQCHGHA